MRCRQQRVQRSLGLQAGVFCACALLMGTLAMVDSAHAAEPSQPEPSQPEPSRPNVLLIIGDDQAWNDYGFMGHEAIQTPHFDQLARDSARFDWGYVPTSLCRPSLATLITGLYPHEHRITGNDPPRGTPREAMLKHVRRVPTLPKWLSEQGYVSLQTGKWWEGHHSEGGFTHGMTHGDPTRGGRHGDLGLKISREGHQPIHEFLDQTGERPFFIWHAPFLPHTPHNPPERLLAKYVRPDRPLTVARYYAMCEWFDETVGDLLKMIDDRGLRENTLVIFANDNGWIQDPDRNGFAPKSKRSPYDGGIRTPILVRWPGRVAPGQSHLPVSTIDVVPTILRACGVAVPESLPGIDLIAAAKHPDTIKRSAIFGEIFEHDLVDLDDPTTSLLYRWVVTNDRWKLIQPHDGKEPVELYDLNHDPHEQQNLASKQPERVRSLQQQLDAWWSVPRAP